MARLARRRSKPAALSGFSSHSVEFGFEIWNGAPGFGVTTFKQAVN